ncbi:hypothetical protein ACM6Q7_06795 [Peribacillus butanolivorans]|uniref:hypothetical protein n=1 Tax=Peribacillus butanolivorans TaxID=421767 RepID=UPI0039FDB8C5
MSKTKTNQIKLYSVDTAAFYTDKENELNKLMLKYQSVITKAESETDNVSKYENLKQRRKSLSESLPSLKSEVNGLVKGTKEHKQLLKKLNKLQNELYKTIEKIEGNNRKYLVKLDECGKLASYITDLEKIKKLAKEELKINQQKLNSELDLFDEDDMRVLRTDALRDTNKISQFESTLSRTLGIENDETTTDIIVIRAYRYTVFKSLVKKGFVNEDGEHYQYFTSSAGMIRNKKSLFVKSGIAESEEFMNKIWCGLNIDKINNTKFTNKEGKVEYGVNINKLNAYLSLCMSSSTPVEDFSMDHVIVVKDFETELKKQKVHYIPKDTFKVEERELPIKLNQMDGAGICIPDVSDKAFQFRAPGFKGLCIPFPIHKFIKGVAKKVDCTVTDIYGKDWNIIGDSIKYIFTESQFKLAKYYSSWQEYKDAFNKGCEFVICKEEDTKFSEKPINYQSLQTLSDITVDELTSLASRTNQRLDSIGDSKDEMLAILGVNNEDHRKDSFQKALGIYPELLTDLHSKERVKGTRDSLYKGAKAGKLFLKGTKRTFMSPDLYAFAEWLFMKIDEPKGLLGRNEVTCKLYPDITLNVLRAPHLFREHILRRNKVDNKVKDWFITNCIYMSSQNLDSKVLMNDFDGDEAMIVSDPLFKYIARRNMKGILPLEYELGISSKEKVLPESLYRSLTVAYSKNIGEVSNQISKIWSLPKNEIDLDSIRQLCYQNNAIIDFAKTSWLPELPDDVKDKIKTLTAMKLPYYFISAKDKTIDQVEGIPDLHKLNDPKVKKDALEQFSPVNKLEYIIEKKKMQFAKVESKFDYRFLMSKKKVVKTDSLIINTYKDLNKNKKSQLDRELKLLGETQSITKLTTHEMIREKLLAINSNEEDVVDMLIQYLYVEKPTSKKTTLWKAFGEVMLQNLQYNLEHQLELCSECETKFRKVNKKKCLCDKCKRKQDRKKDTERKGLERESKKQKSDKILAG